MAIDLDYSPLTCWVVLPRDCTFVPIENIAGLVEKAVADSIERRHEGDKEAIYKALVHFGYYGVPTLHQVVTVIRKLRDAGRIRVFGRDGFGAIDDFVLELGTLTPEYFAILLADEWRMGLRDEQAATSKPKRRRLRPVALKAQEDNQ